MINYRKKTEVPLRDCVEKVADFNFLPAHIKDLTWRTNTSDSEKSQRRLHFLSAQEKCVPQKLLFFYECSIKSILTYHFTMWYFSCAVAQCHQYSPEDCELPFHWKNMDSTAQDIRWGHASPWTRSIRTVTTRKRVPINKNKNQLISFYLTVIMKLNELNAEPELQKPGWAVWTERDIWVCSVFNLKSNLLLYSYFSWFSECFVNLFLMSDACTQSFL